jgi:hypothetical protein
METGSIRIAAFIGEPARATMLLSLLDGCALPAGELAFSANVAPQTASGHLAKPVEGGSGLDRAAVRLRVELSKQLGLDVRFPSHDRQGLV